MWSRLQLFELHYQVGLNRQSKVAWHQMRRLQVEDYQVVEVEMGKEGVRKEKRRRREEGEKGEEEGEGEEEEEEVEEEKECQVVDSCRYRPNWVEEVEVVVEKRTWV